MLVLHFDIHLLTIYYIHCARCVWTSWAFYSSHSIFNDCINFLFLWCCVMPFCARCVSAWCQPNDIDEPLREFPEWSSWPSNYLHIMKKNWLYMYMLCRNWAIGASALIVVPLETLCLTVWRSLIAQMLCRSSNGCTVLNAAGQGEWVSSFLAANQHKQSYSSGCYSMETDEVLQSRCCRYPSDWWWPWPKHLGTNWLHECLLG